MEPGFSENAVGKVEENSPLIGDAPIEERHLDTPGGSQVGQKILNGKVQRLGDFIDTDAVSLLRHDLQISILIVYS